MARLPLRQEAIFNEVARVAGWRLNNVGPRKGIQKLRVVTVEPFLDNSGNHVAPTIHQDEWIFSYPSENPSFGLTEVLNKIFKLSIRNAYERMHNTNLTIIF